MQLLNFEAMGMPVRGMLHDGNRLRPALVVIPGGGYQHLSARESDPPALEYFTMGYQVFILSYSLDRRAGELRPLHEAAEAVKTIRENSESWNIDPGKIAVMGFSAGGHLAATLGALWNHPGAGLPGNCRPDALILCYPVITMGAYAHPGSRDMVTGGEETLRELMSVEKQITPDCPPVFVWHTVDDEIVPVENTLLLVSALRRNGIPLECHLFAHGIHGLSVCTEEVGTPSPLCRQWLPLSKAWLNSLFAFEP